MNEQDEKFRQKCLARLKTLRLIDDDFFAVCFANDTECTEFILRILLEKQDLNVVEAKTQYAIDNLKGHSVILDVYATDSSGRFYDIEMQRGSKGATPKRARYNSSLMDAQLLLPGDEYSMLPESYVIFITERDILKKGLPIYHIDRTIEEVQEKFEDGSHIIYANASVRDDTQLGRLMQDLTCTEPDDMHYAILADRTKYFKYEEEGVSHMCEFWQELKDEGRAEAEQELKAMKLMVNEAEARAAEAEEKAAEAEEKAAEAEEKVAEAEKKAKAKAAEAEVRNSALKNAFKMLLGGKLTVDEIAEYTNLPIEEVMEFAVLAAK